MQLGLFMPPAHPPERFREPGGYKACFEWDLALIKKADDLGFAEAWIGEHYSHHWEPFPAPDLLLQTAWRETKQIKLGAGTFITPFRHPAELAAKISYQDQLFEGRYLVGVGAGSVPTDFTMFNIDFRSGEQRERNREAVEIMTRYWVEPGPWRHEGKFWTCEKVATEAFEAVPGALGHHLVPYQKPHPRIAVSGQSPDSPSLEWAGEMGYIPMSSGSNRALGAHWETIERGARKSGLVPDRSDWRVSRHVVVADTDEEAVEQARNSFHGRLMREMLLPVFSHLGVMGGFKHDDSVSDDQINLDYLIEHSFLVGSVETVVRGIEEMQSASGGFGTLLVSCSDESARNDEWMHSMELLATEVLPRVNQG
jgi:alkanesulfonate monooxygenase SsuD/methylene tetrahydromethanopterin reductase-like flavin-dependent oxidoreductase (luciferase family)